MAKLCVDMPSEAKIYIKHITKGTKTYFFTWMEFDTLAAKEGGAGCSTLAPVAMDGKL